MTQQVLSRFTNNVAWRNDKASFKNCMKDVQKYKKEVESFNKAFKKNMATSASAAKYQGKYTKQVKTSTIAERARIKTQQVTDKLTGLNEKSTQALNKKLEDLNGQFKAGKLTQQAYNFEMNRTSKFYQDIQREARLTQKAQEKLARSERALAAQRKKEAGERIKQGAVSGSRALATSLVTGFAGIGAIGNASSQAALEREQAYNTAGGSKAGVDFTNFQNLAAAAKIQGVSQDQLGDQMKDVSDKIGDFLQTGGGEAKDLVAVLNKSGITSSQLEKMSPDKLFKLLPKVFKDQEIGLKQQVFLLESLVNDGSKTVKALNSLEEVTKQRERFGLNISRADQDALLQTRKNMNLVGEGLSKLGEQFTVGFFGDSAKDVDALMLAFKEAQPVVKGIGEDLRGFTITIAENANAVKGFTGALLAAIVVLKGMKAYNIADDFLDRTSGNGRNGRGRTPSAGGRGGLVAGLVEGIRSIAPRFLTSASTVASTATAAATAPITGTLAAGAGTVLLAKTAFDNLPEDTRRRMQNNNAAMANSQSGYLGMHSGKPQSFNHNVTVQIEGTDGLIQVVDQRASTAASNALGLEYDNAYMNINANR